MRKIILLSFIIGASLVANAQNLESKILDNAAVVLKINAAKLFENLSESEFENSELFKELSYELFRGKAMAKPSQFSDMGISTKDNFFFAAELDKDITYYYYTYKISNLAAFEKFVKSEVEDKQVSKSNGLTTILYDYTNRLVWNSKYAVFIASTYTGEEFYTSSYYYDYDYYNYYDEDETKEDKTIEEMEIEIIKLEAELKELDDKLGDNSFSDDELKILLEELTNAMQENAEETEAVEEYAFETIEESAVDAYTDEDNDEQEKRKEKKRALRNLTKKIERKKKEIAKEKFVKDQTNLRIAQFFKETQTKSKQINGFDNTAVASVWYNTMDMMSVIEPNRNRGYYGGFGNMVGFQKMMDGNFVANMFFKQDRLQLKASLAYSDEINESVQRVYDSKMNKKFIKYIPNNMLGYSSVSLNSEEMYKTMEEVSKKYFENSEEEYADLIGVYIDFLEVMIDEEALGELATGDAVFILNDLLTKEVEYTSYEYDADFNSTKVTKTKEELLPEFTVMFGSENKEMIFKLLKIGNRRDLIIEKNNYFIISEEYNELPFKLYIAYKDDIIFLTSSDEQLAAILNGKVENKLASVHKKMILKNQGTAYFNAQEITNKALLDKNLARELGFLFDVKDDLREMFYTAKMDNGTFNMDMYMTLPEGSKSGSHYLLNLIDAMLIGN